MGEPESRSQAIGTFSHDEWVVALRALSGRSAAEVEVWLQEAADAAPGAGDLRMPALTPAVLWALSLGADATRDKLRAHLAGLSDESRRALWQHEPRLQVWYEQVA